MKQKRWLALGLGGTLLPLALFTGAAHAQVSDSQRIRTACRNEIAGLCAGAAANRGRALDCLQNNRGRLSPACMAAVNAMSPALDPAQQRAAPPPMH